MKQSILIKLMIILLLAGGYECFASQEQKPGAPKDLIVPPNSETENSVILLWDKPERGPKPASYVVYCDGQLVNEVSKTNCTVTGLTPETNYTFCVKSKDAKGNLSSRGSKIIKQTKKQGTVFNVKDYGAKGDGLTKDTKAIQDAIDACTPGGTVYLSGGTFISGALFLKSNMTFYLAKGAILKGSLDVRDYLPMIKNRFSGWHVNSYASLLTAGSINHKGGYGITDLSICGEGTISGSSTALGEKMMDAENDYRNRLICLMNCQNVNIQGLTLEESPSWTVHYIYSKDVSCHDLTIRSTAQNGDGMDPDSSTGCYIFNCTFSTNDDCIAIKSGKNPEGYYIARPSENIFISECNFAEGHSVAIGSEMSGGVRNVVIRDCILDELPLGVQVKVTKDRGGYVEGLKVIDCKLPIIAIKTSVGYNNNGGAAPVLPYIKNLTFSRLDMTSAKIDRPAIFVEGFAVKNNYTKSLIFRNIKLSENATVTLSNCKDFNFQNVLTVSGEKPDFKVTDSENINY